MKDLEDGLDVILTILVVRPGQPPWASPFVQLHYTISFAKACSFSRTKEKPLKLPKSYVIPTCAQSLGIVGLLASLLFLIGVLNPFQDPRDVYPV